LEKWSPFAQHAVLTAAGWCADAGRGDRDDVPTGSTLTGLVRCQRELKLRGEAEKKATLRQVNCCSCKQAAASRRWLYQSPPSCGSHSWDAAWPNSFSGCGHCKIYKK